MDYPESLAVPAEGIAVQLISQPHFEIASPYDRVKIAIRTHLDGAGRQAPGRSTLVTHTSQTRECGAGDLVPAPWLCGSGS
jgi:hypothetical protein